MTSSVSSSNFLTRKAPMKPAAPVISTVLFARSFKRIILSI